MILAAPTIPRTHLGAEHLYSFCIVALLHVSDCHLIAPTIVTSVLFNLSDYVLLEQKYVEAALMEGVQAFESKDIAESAALVIADGHRASEIIDRIRALAKKTPPRKDWLDINEAILEVIALTSGSNEHCQ